MADREGGWDRVISREWSDKPGFDASCLLLIPNEKGRLVASVAIKGYAVMAKSRASAAPEIPTVDEAELPGLYMSSWQGLWVPKGTPKDVVGKLNTAAMDSLADPNIRARITGLGLEIPARDQQTPVGALQKAEIENWWPIVKAANIKSECHVIRSRTATQSLAYD